MTLSDKLARQVRRHLGAEAEGELAASGAPKTAPEALAGLLAEIDAAYGEEHARLKTALRNLDVSSEEQVQAAARMEQLNLSMATVFDSLGRGLLFFGRDGLCSPIFSKSCLTLLETSPGGKHVGDVLIREEGGAARMQALLDVVFQGDSTIFSFEELMAHAPRKRLHSSGSVVSLEYRAMYARDGGVHSILVIAQDTTHEEAAAQNVRAMETRIARMLRMTKDKMAFARYIQRLDAALVSPKKKPSVDELARDLHTLKGLSKFFHLDSIARVLHEMENSLQTQSGLQPEELVAANRETLGKLYEEARGFGHEIWGRNFDIAEEAIVVPVSYAVTFGKDLRRQGAQAVAQRYFQKIVAQSVADLVVPFQTQLSYFAEMSERKVTVADPTSPGEVRVFPTVYKDFFESLVHVARNIVDHAWEPAEVREKAGKPPVMTVNVNVAFENEFRANVKLTISDDGAGVPVEKLRKKVGSKAAAETPEQVLQHVFDQRISTRDKVSQESGRGIGLHAVKAAAQKIAGSVHVASEEGKGTAFTFLLPVIWEPER